MWGFQNRVRLSVPRDITLASSISVLQLVIDASMERSSRVLQRGNPRIWFFLKFEIEFWLVLKSLNQHSSRSQHAPIWRHRWCIVGSSRVSTRYLVWKSITLLLVIEFGFGESLFLTLYLPFLTFVSRPACFYVCVCFLFCACLTTLHCCVAVSSGCGVILTSVFSL